MFRRIRTAIRFYVGIPGGVVCAAVVALVWRPAASFIHAVLSQPPDSTQVGNVARDVAVNVVSEFVAIVLLAIGIFAFLKNRRLHARCGAFNAFDIEASGNPKPWGTITLAYELMPTGLFEPQVRCRLVHDDIELLGQAIVTADQYLSGYYIEVGKLGRRRTGAFVMQLDGEGNTYEGCSAYIDPKTHKPKSGRIRWTRIPE